MGNIITFPNKEKTINLDQTVKEKYQDLVSKLQSNPANDYSIKEAEKLADTILEIDGYSDIQAPPPIVNITKSFGFSVFEQPNMKPNESGNIYIGGTTDELFNSNKVILVSDKEEYFHQRFIIVHELGHYLMNYLSNTEYTDNPKRLFSKPYLKQNHHSKEELRTSRFAAELLMPARLFSAMYIRAVEDCYRRNYTIAYLSSFFKVRKSCVEKRILEVIVMMIKSGIIKKKGKEDKEMKKRIMLERF